MTPESVRRVLLVRLSALGDIVHALPAFRRVREALPDAHVAWLIEDTFAPMLEGIEGLDERILVPRRRARRENELGAKWRAYAAVMRHVRTRRFDVAFDLQGLLKSAFWVRLSGAKHRVGYHGKAAREGSWLAYNQRVKIPFDDMHIIERHLFLVGSFLDHPTKPVPAAGIPDRPEVRSRVEAWLEQLERHGPLVVLNPGAGWPTKQWPAAMYGRLASSLVDNGCDVLVLWGPGEEELAEEVRLGAASDGVHVLPPTDFYEMIEVLRHADLTIAGDTGPLHIAAAVGTLTVGIYGPSEVVRNGPYGDGHLVVRNDLDCLECWKHKCGPPLDRRCMTELSVDFVQNACMQQLAKK